MTNTTTNRMKRLIADISEHGATPSRVKKITNALRAVTAERDAAADSISELRELNVRLTDRIQNQSGEIDAATARVAELEARLHQSCLHLSTCAGSLCGLARELGDEALHDKANAARAFLAKKENRDD
jgi:chromosome segregation ATPase